MPLTHLTFRISRELAHDHRIQQQVRQYAEEEADRLGLILNGEVGIDSTNKNYTAFVFSVIPKKKVPTLVEITTFDERAQGIRTFMRGEDE